MTSRSAIAPRLKAAVLSIGLAAGFAAVTPPSRAQRSPDRWVGTWSTSLVGRPQTPPLPGPPGPAPFMASACPAPPPPATPPVTPPPGQTFAPPPFTHFTNQTLRQIVHTSLGGTRVRVVLSNAFGTRAAHDRRRPHRPPRQRRRDSARAARRSRSPAGRRSRFRRSRSSYSDPVAHAVSLGGRSRHRHLPAGHDEHALAAHDARRGVSDELHLGDRQSCRAREVPDGRDHAQLVPDLACRGRCARRRGRHRRVRRFDHRRRRVHRRHEPPLARRAGGADAVVVGGTDAARRRERRDRRQSRAQRCRVRLRHQRARAVRHRRAQPDRRHARHRHGRDQRHRQRARRRRRRPPRISSPRTSS